MALRPEWRILDLTTGETIRSFMCQGHPTVDAAIAEDARAVVALDVAGNVVVCDLDTGYPLRTLGGFLQGLAASALSAEGDLLATIDELDSTTVWDLDHARQWCQWQPDLQGLATHERAVAFIPGTRTLAVAPRCGLFTLDAGRGMASRCREPALSFGRVRARRHFVAGLEVNGRAVHLWRLPGWEVEGHWSAEELTPALLSSGGATVSDVDVSEDGSLLALGFLGGTGELPLADGAASVDAGRRALLWHSDGTLVGVQFTRGGKGVLYAGGNECGLLLRDGSAKWRSNDMRRGNWPSAAYACSPDARWIAYGDLDGAIHLLDGYTGKEAAPAWPGDGLQIEQMCFSQNGSRLACQGQSEVTIREVPSGRKVATLLQIADLPGQTPGWLIVTPEGYYAGTEDAAKYINWELNGELYPVSSFAERFYRPDLVAKALRGERLDDVAPLTAEQVPPQVRITFPKDGVTVEAGAERVQVTIAATGARKIERVEVSVNGRRVSVEVERGIALAAKGIALAAKDMPAGHTLAEELSGLVPLPPGEQQIRLRALAYDEAGMRSPPAEVWLYRPGAQPVAGDLHVLAVGVSQYRNRDYNLRFAAADAEALAQALQAQAPRLYKAVHSRVLVNEQVTVPELRGALEQLCNEVSSKDCAVLFLSGHGVRDEGGAYFFATHEADIARLTESALAWEEIREAVRRLAAKQVVVLVDSCHGGAVLGERLATNEALVEELARRAGALVFASSSGAEVSVESEEWGHGAFTYALLELLRGQREARPRIGPIELLYHVCQRVRELTQGCQNPNIPLLTNFPADVTLFATG
ncbi:MAG: hypothetical protein FJX75_09520 [Armatimonadetes bacterium]|nr:hypothetical protein [Armatimonadota bacterium]